MTKPKRYASLGPVPLCDLLGFSYSSWHMSVSVSASYLVFQISLILHVIWSSMVRFRELKIVSESIIEVWLI